MIDRDVLQDDTGCEAASLGDELDEAEMTSVMGPEERRMLQQAARARSDRAPKPVVRDGDSKRPTARPPAPSAAPDAVAAVELVAPVASVPCPAPPAPPVPALTVTAPEAPPLVQSPALPEAPARAPLALAPEAGSSQPAPGPAPHRPAAASSHRAALAAHVLLAMAVIYALLH